jgi:hypothetical protein
MRLFAIQMADPPTSAMSYDNSPSKMAPDSGVGSRSLWRMPMPPPAGLQNSHQNGERILLIFVSGSKNRAAAQESTLERDWLARATTCVRHPEPRDVTLRLWSAPSSSPSSCRFVTYSTMSDAELWNVFIWSDFRLLYRRAKPFARCERARRDYGSGAVFVESATGSLRLQSSAHVGLCSLASSMAVLPAGVRPTTEPRASSSQNSRTTKPRLTIRVT